MPRIAFMQPGATMDMDHPDYEPDQPMDVCKFCYRAKIEGKERLPDIEYYIDDNQAGGIITGERIDHPPYIECDYECDVCGDHLHWSDD